MATKAQIKANQQNAEKSTGPQTAEGKAVVSQNAVKHGLFAAKAVISGEDPADYELYRDKYLAELAPAGMLESVLAERIVSLSWRLQRAERIQNEVFDDMIGRKVTNNPARRERECYYINQGIYRGDPRMNLDDLPLGRIATSDWSNGRVLERLMLYERRIENSLYKTINRLKQYQVIRQIKLDETDKPSPSVKEEAATRRAPADKLSDLKKQSQFAAAHLAAKSSIKGDYNNNPASGDEENKADQSQFHEHALPKGVENRKKSLISANLLNE